MDILFQNLNSLLDLADEERSDSEDSNDDAPSQRMGSVDESGYITKYLFVRTDEILCCSARNRIFSDIDILKDGHPGDNLDISICAVTMGLGNRDLTGQVRRTEVKETFMVLVLKRLD